MAIVNGDPVSEAGTNPKLASKQVDNSFAGVQELANSGSTTITDAQQTINNIITSTGMADQNATGLAQSSTNYITSGDPANDSLDNLDTQLNTTDSNLSSHTSAATNVHGIGASSSVVGTLTTQTFQNKTLTNVNNTTRTTSGTKASPDAITAAGGITAAAVLDQIIFVEGDGGAIDITASPQISAGTKVGQRMLVIGTSDSNTVQLDDGDGLDINGACELTSNQSIDLMWDGTTWFEVSRRA